MRKTMKTISFQNWKFFNNITENAGFAQYFLIASPFYLNHQQFFIYYCLIANYRKDLDTKDSFLQNKDILFFRCISNAFRNIGIQGARKSWFHLCYFANLQSILLRNFSEIDIQCHKSRQSLIKNVRTFARNQILASEKGYKEIQKDRHGCHLNIGQGEVYPSVIEDFPILRLYVGKRG